MEHSSSLEALNVSKAKHTLIDKLLGKCFCYEERESILNLREYLDDFHYVLFRGEGIGPDCVHFTQVDSSKVPEKYLIEAHELKEAKEDAKAWIRMWSNYCSEIMDFNNGLPGESYEFSCDEVKERWEEMAQGEAFADLESRIFAHKLL